MSRLYLSTALYTGEEGSLMLISLWYSFMFWYASRSSGRSLDKQHRKTEGKPHFVEIPRRYKWLFSFDYLTGMVVVKEGLTVQVVGYLFSAFEVCCAVFAYLFQKTDIIRQMSFYRVLAYVLIAGYIMTRMEIRYERNMQNAFDYDWISYFQHAVIALPKRKCVVLSKMDASTYEIRLSISRKKYGARSSVEVTIGAKYYAVHSYEQGYPFWSIRDH